MRFKGEGIRFLSPTNKRDGGSITAGLGWLGAEAAPSFGGKARTGTRHPVHAGLHQLPKRGQGIVGTGWQRSQGSRGMNSRL